MSVVFFAHVALLGSSCSLRTNLYAANTQNFAPCLNKKYSLIKSNISSFLTIFRCGTFLDAYILIICSASKVALRLILKEITRSNADVINRVVTKYSLIKIRVLTNG